MATVVITHTARADLEHLIGTRSLPISTRDRVKASLAPLAAYPLLGRELLGRWEGFRVVLGPWPWMLLVYAYDEAIDRVAVLTIQDSRSVRAPTAQR